jgi:putative DNA primase/helicase
MKDIRDQARNKWASILSHFGIDDDFLTGKHGPCPMCGGKDRFRFDNQEGRGTWICNVCGAGDGMHLILKTRWSFKDAARNVREMLGEASEAAPKREIDPEVARQLRRELWMGSTPIGNDEAAAYLASRGFRGPYPAALRYTRSAEGTDHPRKSRCAAMLALVSGPDGKPVNIHRTYLENGWKAQMPEPRRMMPGKLAPGSAIRLYPHDGRLGVAEGIETAMAVTRDFGISCWSLVNSSMLEKFVVPDGVSELHIFGDNDRKFGGQASAYRLAYRLATKPDAPQIFVRIPEMAGTDWENIGRKVAA